jgi:uncharacterized membrane protein
VTGAASRWLALAGLVAIAALLLRPPDAAGMLAAAPLAALILSGFVPLSRWAIATAILMLPYFSYGIMQTITDPAGRMRAVVFSALTVATFLAALDSARRSPRNPR